MVVLVVMIKSGSGMAWNGMPALRWPAQNHTATFFPRNTIPGTVVLQSQYRSQCVPDCLQTSAIALSQQCGFQL